MLCLFTCVCGHTTAIISHTLIFCSHDPVLSCRLVRHLLFILSLCLQQSCSLTLEMDPFDGKAAAFVLMGLCTVHNRPHSSCKEGREIPDGDREIDQYLPVFFQLRRINHFSSLICVWFYSFLPHHPLQNLISGSF